MGEHPQVAQLRSSTQVVKQFGVALQFGEIVGVNVRLRAKQKHGKDDTASQPHRRELHPGNLQLDAGGPADQRGA